MTSTTRRAGSQKIRNQALPAATASPGPQLTHPQPPRLNSYVNRAPQWRLSALAFLTLAAFIPPAIPATASASTDPHSFLYGQYNSPPGNVFINDVKAVARTSRHRVFNVKFQFRVGATGVVSAVNRAKALTKCTGCSAVAIGFQVVTTPAAAL